MEIGELAEAANNFEKQSDGNITFENNSSVNASGRLSPEDLKMWKDLFQQTMNTYEKSTESWIIAAFSVLIFVSAFGNGLVCYVVIKNPHMRTPSNAFITNLALSDLILSLITQPLNLMKLFKKTLVTGNTMCKLIPVFQGTNVFVSTISITAIALDRMQLIVYPTGQCLCHIGVVATLAGTWVIAVALALPLLRFTTQVSVDFGYPFGRYIMCLETENENFPQERLIYSIAVIIFQYVIPIVVVSFAHVKIYGIIRGRKDRWSQRSDRPENSDTEIKRKTAENRERKTMLLLLMIALVFAISWLPLNIFNIIADINEEMLLEIDNNMLIFPICHLLVLCSACANPVLYGWLNENFRKEFLKVFCCLNIKCKNQETQTGIEVTPQEQLQHAKRKKLHNLDNVAPKDQDQELLRHVNESSKSQVIQDTCKTFVDIEVN